MIKASLIREIGNLFVWPNRDVEMSSQVHGPPADTVEMSLLICVHISARFHTEFDRGGYDPVKIKDVTRMPG